MSGRCCDKLVGESGCVKVPSEAAVRAPQSGSRQSAQLCGGISRRWNVVQGETGGISTQRRRKSERIQGKKRIDVKRSGAVAVQS